MTRKQNLLSAAAIIVVLAGLVVAPTMLGRYGVYILTMWTIMSMAALGLNLTLGYAGQVSLAQGAFVGVGAYTVAILGAAGWPFFVLVPIAAALCFAIGWALGYPALRVQHHYLAFVTLSFSTLAFLVFRNEEWLTNGILGISDVKRPNVFGISTESARAYYYLCLAALVVLAAGLYGLIRSPWGRAFLALRENPMRAMSLGIDTRRYTLMAFAIGSAFGGVAGTFYGPLVEFVDPSPFHLTLSLNLLLMVIVGGSGFFFGPFLGALISVLLPEWLRFMEGYYLIAYAIFVMALLIVSPTGILGIVDRMLQDRKTRAASAARQAASATYMEPAK